MKDAIQAIGKDVLHIKKEEIGTHSISSSAAMAMFLGNCSVCLIMMIGCWSSDASLRYIQKQVKQFCHNVSKRMTKTHDPLAHPNIHNSFKFPPRPKAKEQPQQCRDKKKCRW
jgi:hypothetical protein